MPVSDRGCPAIALACGMYVARQGPVSGSSPRNCARPRRDAVESLAGLRQGRVCYRGEIIGSDRGKSYTRALEQSLP